MGVTPSGGNALFYNKQSDIPNYSSRTDLMIVRTESTSNYHPQYYLGRRSDLAINASSNVSVGFDYGQSISASVPSEGQFFFSEGLNEHDWKVMKKKRITRFTGHRIEKVEDKYTLYANSQEGYFPHDMFYKCGCLQSVILPRGLRVNYTVIDETSKVKYNIPSDEITILFIRKKFRNRRYYPEYLGSYGIERKKCITGDSAKSLISAFKDLSPAQADTGYKMDARASFYVEYSNGHDPEHYYLGLDEKYIQKGEHSGQYYEMSDKLRSELREIGIL
ncbi:MAG: hypothetical protein MJZ16_14590, partial [Bacteroidales bacterium]|nr:hypothetical protein [Bacteroidales bacterium]